MEGSREEGWSPVCAMPVLHTITCYASTAHHHVLCQYCTRHSNIRHGSTARRIAACTDSASGAIKGARGG
eukprot:1348349-Rhodomonas_salina.1